MPVTTLSLTTPRYHTFDGGWVPTTEEASPVNTQFKWARITPTTPTRYRYSMAAGRVELASVLPVGAVVLGATLHVEGRVQASGSLAGATLFALSSCPDFLVESASGIAGNFSDFAPVATGDIGRWSWTYDGGTTLTYTMSGGDIPFDLGLFVDGVFEFRAGFDAGQTPATFGTASGGTAGEGVTATSLSCWIAIEYECVQPDPYENAIPACEEPYTLDTMQVYQIETNDAVVYSYLSTPWVTVKNDNDYRALLWFDTCQLSHLFSSITSAYLRVSLDYLERYPCNPALYAYYVQPNQPVSNELQPVGDEVGADYLLTEYGSAFDPIELWALGAGVMTLDYEDEDGSFYTGPATVTFALDTLSVLDGRVTGIVLAGNYDLGEGYLDINVAAAALLICGVPNDSDDDGTPDLDDPAPFDPNNPTPQEPGTPARPETPGRDVRSGERPIEERAELPQAFEIPSPTRMEAMRRFLVRLKRDG